MKQVKKTLLLISIMFMVTPLLAQQGESNLKIPLNKSVWWAGIVNRGEVMPLKNGFSGTFFNNYGNQVQPLLISNDGQTIWSNDPYTFEVKNDTIFAQSNSNNLVYNKTGKTLKDAFLFASKTYFPPAGKLPDELLFTSPQYNTWIELMYDQNQNDILNYANNILDNGFPSGVLMIDDNWQENYGKWNFHQGRFSNPKLMMDSLHNMGFKVMLWVCPFVSPDCDVYRELEQDGLLLKDETGKPAIVRWWNGASALLDLSNPKTGKWFQKQLDFLQNEYHVDGFKFDAGDFEFYENTVSYIANTTPQEHSKLYGKIGLKYPLNEYRAMWKMAGEPIVNRLRDKFHEWEDVQKLVPHLLLQGIVGYNFTCPDMVGGGDFESFLPGSNLDEDMIVRSAQAHALMPMMQFSVAPWRILDKEHFVAVKKAVKIRKEYIPIIMDLTKKSAKTGEPILRSLEYVFPHKGYEKINDQFMLGDNILVAPLLTKSKTRTVVIPKGKWKDQKGEIIEGPKTISIKVAIDKIPIYKVLK